MFNPDKAINSSKDDVLGRKDVAKELGEAILKDTNKDSHVIAIYGKWGSGKTSYINMVLEHIEENTIDWKNDEKPIIIKFNPWNFSNQNQLIGLFFNQLANALGKKDNSALLKNVAASLRTYSKMILPLSLVPLFTPSTLAVSTASTVCAEAAESIGNYLEKDLEETKNDICKSLHKIEQRIIIVIDDIDRLNEIEIRQTFQLVKSLADFPYTTYILTFDRDVVSKALEPEQGGYGKQYLEKIVQIPFELPGASNWGVQSKLDAEFMKVIESNPHNDFERIHWGNAYESGLKYFFKNMRDINRYSNVLNFNYEVIKEEVNVIDFISITAIQVFSPDIYHGIKNNKDVFSGIMSSTNVVRSDNDKKICDDLLNQYGDNAKILMKKFLSVLFPRIQALYGNYIQGDGFLDSWRKSRRICSEDKFDAYFRLSLPEGKISQSEIRELLSNEADATKVSQLMLKFNEDGKILDFLRIFPDYTKDIPPEYTETFVTAIMDVGDLFPEDNSMFYGTPMRIHLIIKPLLEQIDSHEKRFEILKSSIENTTDGLFTFLWEIDFQDEMHGKYHYEEAKIPMEKQLINSEHLEQLEKLACNKISYKAENGTLIKSPHLYTILKLWEQWDGGNKHQEYIESIVSTDLGLSKLIVDLVSKKTSQSVDNYVSETSWGINVNALNEITGLTDLKERVVTIKESPIYVELDKDEKFALDVYLKEIEKQKVAPL